MAQFRTKARAVELLGKGQIADLPTAISELWKNGYDAYADALKCDLYLRGYKDIENPLFVLSDTGFGMSENDILNKWIVLGTDSKSRGMELLSVDQRFGLKQRVPMGEKGIGRLSVAYLGSPMLMITKKKNHDVQIILFDWRILENYNLFVDDVNIPLKSCPDISNIDSLVYEMKEELISNLYNTTAWFDQPEIAFSIEEDTKNIFIPRAIKENILAEFSNKDYHGTTFIVFKPHEQLIELSDLSEENETDALLEMRRSLGAMFNIFANNPDFSTEFNIRNGNGCYNIINDFFDKQDFSNADHYIRGRFDENGFFEGNVRVYKKTYNYSFRPIRVPGKTPYGPFELELGVLEAHQKNSLLNPEAYSVLDTKTSRFGGLYVYRDYFRVLPYGRIDYDFLQFESRRMKRAGDYYFSYNKMFGYLGITRENNRGLTDKAGREGFIENKAYKEFKRDLIAFFIDLAKSFFATTKDDFENARSEQQKEIQRQNEKMADIEKRNSTRARTEFMARVRSNSEEISRLEDEIKSLKEKLRQAAENLSLSYDTYKHLGDELDNKRAKLRRLSLRKPQRISLTERQHNIYSDFSTNYEHVSSMAIDCAMEMNEIRKRFDVNDLRNDFINRQTIAIANIGKTIAGYKKRVGIFADRAEELLREEQRSYTDRFKEEINESVDTLVTAEDYRGAVAKIIRIEDSIKDSIDERLRPFVDHLDSMSLDVNDDILVSWYKEQKAKVEEKLEFTTSLAQLGISVEIIDHQFNVLYSQMASSMKLLKQYVRTHTELEDTYHQMHNAFEHMEQNYKMLRPLYRSTQRRRTEFTGRNILDNIILFFRSKIENLNVEITSNEDFDTLKFFSFESDLLSVFINIINNALYWLIPVSTRKIRIEYIPSNGLILIMNSGVPIPDSELSKIFTIFYTKRKDGRGIGLYLALRNLNANNYTIFASNAVAHNKLGGACFVIAPERK